MIDMRLLSPISPHFLKIWTPGTRSITMYSAPTGLVESALHAKTLGTGIVVCVLTESRIFISSHIYGIDIGDQSYRSSRLQPQMLCST